MAILQQVAEFAPEALVVRIWLARLAIAVGDDASAARAIRAEAVDHLPNVHLHYCRIAGIYLALEDLAAAERYLSLAKNSSPESTVLWRMLGTLQRMQGNVDEAVSSFQHCASLEPTKKLRIQAIQNAATSLADAGRKDVAAIYQQILEIDQHNPFAYYGLVECQSNLHPSDPIIKTIHELVASRSIAELQKSHLHYALGIVYSTCGNPGASFAHLMIANRIRANGSPRFDSAKKKAQTDARCAVFTSEMIERLSQYGCQEDVLVCVVGMPRSGTTLTEQILGAHPGMCPLGERGDFWRAARNLPSLLKTKLTYPECCTQLTPEAIGQMWRTILDRLRRTAGPRKRMITKLPEDFFEIGLIRILFPKARFINCRRNPLDVCLSCFMQNFRHIPYARDLHDLASVFRMYRQMMDHWRVVLPPSSIHDVNYEELVADPTNIVRGMCDFIGLPFQESSLDFHNRSQRVQTMSRWQVRQPIYQTSLNRSDAYREFLGPVLDLDDALSANPDVICQ